MAVITSSRRRSRRALHRIEPARISRARALAILGNSITTDHISRSADQGEFDRRLYLQSLGVAPADFNNYGARRMNHEVMVRGAFANQWLRNQMVPGVEGGYTTHQPTANR